MTHTIEIVNCKPKANVETKDFEAAAAGIESILSEMEGFKGRQFGRGSDGSYIDVVHWNDMECAKQAAEKVMSKPECLAFFQLIDEDTMSMRHFDTVG